MPVPFVAAASLGLSALSFTKGVLDSQKKDSGAKMPDATAQLAALEEEKQTRKNRLITGRRLPGQELIEQKQSAITSEGINKLENTNSANYTSNLNKFVNKEREANVALGIAGAERYDKLQDDVLDIDKRKIGILNKQSGFDSERYKEGAAADRARKTSAWSNIESGLKLAVDAGGVIAGSGGGKPPVGSPSPMASRRDNIKDPLDLQ
jgi:hypothetical protein